MKMKDEDKTKSQLIAELRELRTQTAVFSPLPEETQSIALGLTRFYFENVSIGIHQLAMDGRILNANPYAADMLGYTVKELTALSIFQIDPFLSADTMETDFTTLAACQWDSFETVHLKKDGSQIPVEITSNRMEYGGQQYAFVFIKEISNRKKNEEQLHRLIHDLKESEERFRALHNSSFGGIMIHGQRRILECNQGLAEITGYSVDELIGMDGMLLIAPRSRELLMEMVVSGHQEPYEAFGVRKNGEEYPIRLAARNIPYKGKQVRTVEFRDITDQKKAEGELRHLKNYLSNIIDSMPSVLVGGGPRRPGDPVEPQGPDTDRIKP